jgi:hypothetical protein
MKWRVTTSYISYTHYIIEANNREQAIQNYRNQEYVQQIISDPLYDEMDETIFEVEEWNNE